MENISRYPCTKCEVTSDAEVNSASVVGSYRSHGAGQLVRVLVSEEIGEEAPVSQMLGSISPYSTPYIVSWSSTFPSILQQPRKLRSWATVSPEREAQNDWAHYGAILKDLLAKCECTEVAPVSWEAVTRRYRLNEPLT